MSTILIVDDELRAWKTMEGILRVDNYTLAYASNGAEALEQAAALIPDLILLDVMMPGMDGFEVCTRLRAHELLAEVPIIMVTALDDRQSRLRGIQAGADDFVSKPVDRVELRARVRTIIRLNRHKRLLTERRKFERVVELLPNGILIVDTNGTTLLANPALLRLVRAQQSEDVIGQSIFWLFSAEEHDHCTHLFQRASNGALQIEHFEALGQRLDGTTFPMEVDVGPIGWDGGPAVQLIVRDRTEHKRAEQQVHANAARARALAHVAGKLNDRLDLEAMLDVLCRESAQALNASAAFVCLHNPHHDELHVVAATGLPADFIQRSAPIKRTSYEQWPAPLSKAVQLSPNESLPAILDGALIEELNIRTLAAVPMLRANRFIGTLNVLTMGDAQPFSEEDLNLLHGMAHQAAQAIDNAQLFATTERHLRQLQALHRIDVAITSGQDLRHAMHVVVQQARDVLNVDAANVLLLNQQSQVLEFLVGLGFSTTLFTETNPPLDNSYAGRAVRKRQTIKISDLSQLGADYPYRALLQQEGFQSYYAVPLVARGTVWGVLEVYHRTLLNLPPEWQNFLESLGRQAAIAIDNATLMSSLQTANRDLLHTYDITLEGWSRALDLRDRETEGHSQRVASMTLRLARRLGIDEAIIPHMHRGALLHDIGKLGIPDAILHKPGPLTEEEWQIMRQHPTYAYQMLSPIDFLQPALDIPYCHHEKWDGSGYPRGLAGEAIPLAARIFAVIDVWDALSHDRPYRAAWPPDQVRDYLSSQSGSHFDPHILAAFLQLLDNNAADPAAEVSSTEARRSTA
jgi:PAS domain S-box-containing protein